MEDKVEELIGIEDFMKINLKVGKVLSSRKKVERLQKN